MNQLENRKRVLEIALESICYRLGDTKMLFANLDLEMSASAAKDAGLLETYKKYCELQTIAVQIQSELCQIAADEDNGGGWRLIGDILGAHVWVCPHCDNKSSDDTVFCPHCGRFVGRGVRK